MNDLIDIILNRSKATTIRFDAKSLRYYLRHVEYRHNVMYYINNVNA